MIMLIFLKFITVANYIDSFFFYLKPILHSWDKPHFVLIYYPFYFLWIWFINILFRLFLSVFMWGIVQYVQFDSILMKRNHVDIWVYIFIYFCMKEVNINTRIFTLVILSMWLGNRERVVNFAFIYLSNVFSPPPPPPFVKDVQA